MCVEKCGALQPSHEQCTLLKKLAIGQTNLETTSISSKAGRVIDDLIYAISIVPDEDRATRLVQYLIPLILEAGFQAESRDTVQ